MFSYLRQILKIHDLRKSIFFVLMMIVIFRMGAHIPIPGVDLEQLREFFASNQVLALVNVLSGGTMERFSILALGVAPYITSSIIFQLLTMIVPRLEELSKEPGGHQKINRYTRYATIPLAFVQSYGLIAILRQSSGDVLAGAGIFRILATMITLTAGTTFLMWIGELISEKRIGNGISILIFAGIIAGLPQMLSNTIVVFDASQIMNLILFGVMGLVTIVAVIIITEGQRNIPVSYARQVRGARTFGGTRTHLPLRVNMAGVIPIIFAIAVLLFPPLVAQFLSQAKSVWVAQGAQFVTNLFANQLFYGLFYFALVFAFTYFYTAVIFHPDQIAENLQKQGGFIPGIRPGRNTSEYLARVASRILFAGALFLGIIAVLPLLVQQITHSQTLVIGGTSLLIVVSVTLEIIKQIDSQLTMRDYEHL